jgi:hypothetical protein
MSLTFYEKDYASNYEELATYYPLYYQDVYEMQEILKAEGHLADGIENGIERAYLNNFIDYADAETIGKLEAFLSLDHNKTKELEMRRRIIKAHFVGNGKMSATLIKSMIQAYTDADVDVELKAYTDNNGQDKYFYMDGRTLCDGTRLLDATGSQVSGTKDQALYITLYRDGTQKVYTSDILSLLADKLPSHIMYVLNDFTETEVNSQTMEKILFSTLAMLMKVEFWDTEYADGSAYLDGSQTLDKRRYICTPGLQYGEKITNEQESIGLAQMSSWDVCGVSGGYSDKQSNNSAKH